MLMELCCVQSLASEHAIIANAIIGKCVVFRHYCNQRHRGSLKNMKKWVKLNTNFKNVDLS